MISTPLGSVYPPHQVGYSIEQLYILYPKQARPSHSIPLRYQISGLVIWSPGHSATCKFIVQVDKFIGDIKNGIAIDSNGHFFCILSGLCRYQHDTISSSGTVKRCGAWPL